MYGTTDVCHLPQGYYSLKVNNVPVAVEGNKVVADPSAKPTVGPFTLQPTLW